MTDAQTIRCAGCGELTTGHDTLIFGGIEGGQRERRSRCFNAEVEAIPADSETERRLARELKLQVEWLKAVRRR